MHTPVVAMSSTTRVRTRQDYENMTELKKDQVFATFFLKKRPSAGDKPRLAVGRKNEKMEGGGTNRSDAGLNLSGSWQQGHSATYNTPSRI